MMILKLCISIYLSIESVNTELNNQVGDSSKYASMWYQTLFGRLHSI
jgi:hypothetical protein